MSGLTVAVLLLGSCDRTERHRVLSFFFDGVPPLPSASGESGLSDPNGPHATDGSLTGGWCVHKPLSDCTQCHGARRRQAFSRQVQLVASVPNLCYKCHHGYAALEGWVHGPVATGGCLLCHEPHKTKNESLLAAPIPDLCHRCHDPQAIAEIERHAEESHAHCNDCHEGHAGATNDLLKPAFLNRPEGRKYLSEVQHAQYEGSLRKARGELARGGNLPAMLQAAAGYIEVGNLWSARAYLEAIGDSVILTAWERSRVAGVLEQVVALLQSQRSEQAETRDGETALATARTILAASVRAIREERGQRQAATADRYYSSIKQYHAAQFLEARAGFREVLADPSVPEPMKRMVKDYLEKIDWLIKETSQK